MIAIRMNLVDEEGESVVETGQLMEFLPSVTLRMMIMILTMMMMMM